MATDNLLNSAPRQSKFGSDFFAWCPAVALLNNFSISFFYFIFHRAVQLSSWLTVQWEAGGLNAPTALTGKIFVYDTNLQNRISSSGPSQLTGSAQSFVSLSANTFKSLTNWDSDLPVNFEISDIRSEVSSISYIIAVDWQPPHIAVSTINLRSTVLKKICSIE